MGLFASFLIAFAMIIAFIIEAEDICSIGEATETKNKISNAKNRGKYFKLEEKISRKLRNQNHLYKMFNHKGDKPQCFACKTPPWGNPCCDTCNNSESI